VNGSLLALDLLFFASTSTKLMEGGWFPLLIAFVISFIMLTWRKGEEVLDGARLELRQRAPDFLAELKADPPFRLPGTAVVLGRMAHGVPLALTQNLRHNRVLHENVLLVAVADGGNPEGAGCRPGLDHAHRRGAHAGGTALRLHGAAGRSGGARAGGGERPNQLQHTRQSCTGETNSEDESVVVLIRPLAAGRLEPRRNVRRLHEAVVQFHPREPLSRCA